MNSNTHLSELQDGIRLYWPDTHFIYNEGLIKGSGTFSTFCVAQILSTHQVSRNTPASPGKRCYLVLTVLRAAKVTFQSPSTTPGFLS